MAKPIIVFSVEEMRERLKSLEVTVTWAEEQARGKSADPKQRKAVGVWLKHRHTVEQMREYLEAYEQAKQG